MSAPGTFTWAEFASADQLVHAAEQIAELHDVELDAYTPFEVPELEQLIRDPRPRLIAGITLAGAIAGGALAFSVIYWTAVVAYPLNIGGRPLNSLPADIPIVFESSILGGALAAFVALFWLCGMPRLGHPLELMEGFERASSDRYWLGVKCHSASLEAELVSLLSQMGALGVVEPEPEAEP